MKVIKLTQIKMLAWNGLVIKRGPKHVLKVMIKRIVKINFVTSRLIDING